VGLLHSLYIPPSPRLILLVGCISGADRGNYTTTPTDLDGKRSMAGAEKKSGESEREGGCAKDWTDKYN